MSDSYYIRVRGEVKGPIPMDQIVMLVRKKRLGRHHEVSTDANNWVRAGDVPDLFEPVAVARELIPVSSELISESQAPRGSEKPRSDVQWMYAKGRNRVGPISEAELRSLLVAGRITGADLVWNDGLEDWIAVGSLPQFASLVFSPTDSSSGTHSAAAAADADSRSLSASGQILTSSLFTLLLGGLTFLAGPVAAFIVIAVSTDAPVFGASTTGRELVNMLIGIAGLTALPLFAAVAGILLGHHSLRIHRKSPSQFEGAGYALTGLIICYAFVTIAVISLLIFLIALAVKTT